MSKPSNADILKTLHSGGAAPDQPEIDLTDPTNQSVLRTLHSGSFSTEGKKGKFEKAVDAGVQSTTDMYAHAAAFTVGGALDVGGQLVAGAAGLSVLGMGGTIEESATLITQVAEWASENVTRNVLHAIGPAKEMDEASENIGFAFEKVMGMAAYMAHTYATPHIKLAQAAGVDTMEYEAALDAAARTNIVAGMFAYGYARGKNMKRQGRIDKRGGKDDFTAEEWAEILRTSLRHPDVPRLSFKGVDTFEQPGRPHAGRLLTDQSEAGNNPVLPAEAPSPYYSPNQNTVQPMPYSLFREANQGPRVKGKPHVYTEVHDEYANHLTLIDEINVKMDVERRSLGIETGDAITKAALNDPAFTKALTKTAMAVARRHATEAQWARGKGFSIEQSDAVAAGHAQLRTSALLAQDKAFGQALARIVGHKNFAGMMEKLPERTKEELLGMLDRVGKRKSLGGSKYGMRDKKETLVEAAERRFGPDAKYRVGSKANVKGGKLARQDQEAVSVDDPKQGHFARTAVRAGEVKELKPTEYSELGQIEFPDVDVLPVEFLEMDHFPFEEKFALHQELNTLREGAQVPGTMEIIFRDAGVDKPLAEQVVDQTKNPMHGRNHRQVAVSARGEVYTPGEVQILRALVGSFLKNESPMTTFHMTTLSQNKAILRYRALVEGRKLGKEHRFSGTKLEDFGMRTKERSTIYRAERRTGEQYMKDKSKFDAERAIYQEAYDAAAPVRKAVQTVKVRHSRKDRLKREAQDRQNVRGKDKRRSEHYDRDSARMWEEDAGSLTLDREMKSLGVDRPSLRAIDKLKGTHKGYTTVKMLRDIARELEIKKPGASLKKLRQSIKEEIQSKGIWEPSVQRGKGPGAITGGHAMGRQRGAVVPDLGVLRLADAVARKFLRAAKVEKTWEPPNRNFRQEADFTVWEKAKLIGGGGVMGPLHTRVQIMSKAGGREFGRLMAMLDQLPRHLWTDMIGDIQSYYQVKTNLMGRWLTSEHNGISLQSVLNKFEAKWFTGPRKYLGALPKGKKNPAGISMHNLKPRMNRIGFEDLTSGLKPTTKIGKAFREYYDNLFQAAERAGIEVAKYEDFYYPPVFKHKAMKVGSKLREQFMVAAERAGHSREVTMEWLNAMIDGEGLITAKVVDAAEKLNIGSKDKNLELNRHFLSKFHPKQLRNFLVDDIGAAAQKYATDVATRMADVERFGKNEVHWQRQLDLAAKEAEDMGIPITTKELEHIGMAREILAHTYGRGSKLFAEFQRIGIAVENFSKLGMVVLGSISEAGIGINNPTMWSHYAKALATTGLPTAARSIARSIYRDVGRTRAMEMAADAGRAVSVAMHEHLTALNAADMGSTWSSLAFIANMQHTFTNSMLTVSAKSFESTLHRIVKDEGRTRLGRKKESDFHKYDVQMLKQYGVPLEQALKWHRDGAKLEGAFYNNTVVPAMIKYMNDTVLTPRGVNLSPWMNKTKYAAVRHLLTYVTMFGNKVTPELIQSLKGQVLDGAPNTMALRTRNRMAGAGSMVAIIGLAILSEELRDMYYYGGAENHPLKDKVDDESWIYARTLRYMNRAGYGGFVGAKILDVVEASQYKKLQGSDVAGSLVGPMWGDIFSVVAAGIMSVQGETTAKEFSKIIVNALPEATMLPRTRKQGGDASREALEELWEGWLIDAGVPKGGRTKMYF